MRHRPGHRLLPRRPLLERTRGSRQPYGLRGRDVEFLFPTKYTKLRRASAKGSHLFEYESRLHRPSMWADLSPVDNNRDNNVKTTPSR